MHSTARNEPRPHRKFFLFGLVILVFTFAATWHWSSVNQWASFETIVAWEQSLKDHPAALVFVAAAYVFGGLVFFPVTVLTVATVFTFGPFFGNLYALVGWTLSAGVGYGIGRLLGQESLRTQFGPRLDYLSREAERNGLIAVLTLRVVPVAPFTLVNIFIGACRIRFCDFMLGSFLGRLPGIVGLTVLEHHLEKTLRAPAVESFLILGVVVALVILANRWLARQLKTHQNLLAQPPLDAPVQGERLPSEVT